MSYYAMCEILSCPQHVEAKKLANKFWVQWGNIGERIANGEDRLCDKAEGIHKQFNEVRRGLRKCCDL